MRRAAAPAPDSRSRIFAAAAREFAAHGFAGASVDRLARRAGVNKAMIYYHFRSKAALYREIFRDLFADAGARARAIAAGEAPPAAKLQAFVGAIASAAERRPHFPAIWLRELADEGRHLDPETFRLLAAVPETLGAILREGRAAGQFRDVHPLLVHFAVAGPLLMFFGSAALRRRFRSAGVFPSGLALDVVVAQVQQSVIGLASAAGATATLAPPPPHAAPRVRAPRAPARRASRGGVAGART